MTELVSVAFTFFERHSYVEDAMNRLKVAASTLMLYCSPDSEPGERSAPMRNNVFSGLTALYLRGACRLLASLVLAFIPMAFLVTGPIAVAQDSKTPAVLPAPSSGKAIVCIYRVSRFTGSAAHD